MKRAYKNFYLLKPVLKVRRAEKRWKEFGISTVLYIAVPVPYSGSHNLYIPSIFCDIYTDNSIYKEDMKNAKGNGRLPYPTQI